MDEKTNNTKMNKFHSTFLRLLVVLPFVMSTIEPICRGLLYNNICIEAVELNNNEAITTRYWDCCKPSCAWPGKAPVTNPVNTCNKRDVVHVNKIEQSACTGGNAFTCSNQAPWNVSNNLSYGFAAVHIKGNGEWNWCCNCYELTFKDHRLKGKKMIVQATNTGYDLLNNHFDIAIPGGGQGIFTGCFTQYGTDWYPETNRYGGVSHWKECYKLPSTLRTACLWRFNWFKNVDNPRVTFKLVSCPKVLTDITGCKRKS